MALVPPQVFPVGQWLGVLQPQVPKAERHWVPLLLLVQSASLAHIQALTLISHLLPSDPAPQSASFIHSRHLPPALHTLYQGKEG